MLHLRKWSHALIFGTLLLFGSAVSAFAAGTSYQGLWWNPNESGWGMTITQHGNTIFAAQFTYTDTGQPIWYVISNCPLSTSTNTCTGDIYKVIGGTSPTVAWNGDNKVTSKVGTGTLTFSDASHGTFDFIINGVHGFKNITPEIFATGATPPAIDYTDMWWNANESGWGVAITQQYGMIFAAWYTYEIDGTPVWYVASSCPVVGTSCTGVLYRVTGGSPLTAPWNGAGKVVNNVGQITFNFIGPEAGTMTGNINGTPFTRSISREKFADPLNVEFLNNQVVITNRITQSKHTYALSTNATSSTPSQPIPASCLTLIDKDDDLNGIPGNEVLFYNGCFAGAHYFIAIDDASQQFSGWTVPLGIAMTWVVAETDPTHAGKEIVALKMGVSYSELYSLRVPTSYWDIQKPPVRVSVFSTLLGVDNLDGGNEDHAVLKELNFNTQFSSVNEYVDNGAYGFYLANTYDAGYVNNQLQAHYLIDTDGRLGKELVVMTPTGFYTGKVHVVDFARRFVRPYTEPWNVNTPPKDVDGSKGAEVCIKYNANAWRMVVDRTQQVVDGSAYCGSASSDSNPSVNPKIAFAALASKTLGNAPFTVSATASSGLAVVFSSTTPSTCAVSGNTVTLLAQGICTVRASLASQATLIGDGNFNAAVNVQQSFTVFPRIPATGIFQSTATTVAGAPFTLSWSSQNASSCVLDKSINGGAWGAVASCTSSLSGTCAPSPTVVGTHVFRQTCTNTSGVSSAATVSHVVTASAAPVATISQSAATTPAGAPFTLAWNSQNATSCVLDKSIDGGAWGAVGSCASSLSGTCTPSPTILGTHVFRFICSGAGGTSPAATVTHTITAATPVATISQSTATTTAGTPFTLAWSSQNATSCVLDKSINGGAWGAVGSCVSALSGTCTPSPTVLGTHVFRLACTGAGGTSPASTVTHTVN